MRRYLSLLLLFAAACTTAPTTAPAPTPTVAQAGGPREIFRSTVLSASNPAGQQVVARDGDDIIVDYEFNDRGRGPKLHTLMRVDANGVPLSIRTTGQEYFKSEVEETYSVAGGTGTWKNPSEAGSAPAGVFYLGYYSPPVTFAYLVRALLAAPGHTLPLAPSGTASVRKAGELTVGGHHISQYEIGGIDLAPLDLWLDDQLEFVGFIGNGLADVRAGYEPYFEQIKQAQEARSTARLHDIAERQTHLPAGGVLQVTNARIFDPIALRVSEPSTIEVRGNRIVRVTPGNAADAGGEVIDASGKMILPGLWNSHAHINDSDGPIDIAAGVTSVHDLGNDVERLLALKQQYGDGTLVGPRIVSRGLIDGRGPLQAPTDLLVSNQEEARATIDRLASLGYEGIKIYSSIDPKLIPFMTGYAHSKGLRASGHIPAGMTAEQAVDAGYDEIHHLNMLFLNFWPDVKETNSPLRFTAVADRGPALDLKSEPVQAFIRKLKAKNITVDPTLTVFEWIFVSRPGQLSPTYVPIANRLPPQVIRYNSAGGGLPVTPEKDPQYRAAFRKMLDLVAELHRDGVRVVPGTDLLSGLTVHRELELYNEAGIPNAEVLRIATWNCVEMLGLQKDLGTVEAGKLADFAIVDGDPLQRMSDIRNVVTVVKDGRVYDSAKLLAEMSIRYEKVGPATAVATANANAASTRKYTVLISGNTAGTQVVTTSGNEVSVDYEYNDRGRGPKTHTVMRLDERGVPLSQTTTGNDYLKAPVEERFTFEHGVARWKNGAEQGEAKGAAFYPSMYGPPEEVGVLAKALLRAGGTLPVLPGGSASIRKAGEMDLHGRHVTSYEIGGLGFEPFEVWLDDAQNYFGSVSSWTSTIREGFEGDVRTLLDAQEARDKQRGAARAARLTHNPAGNRILVTGARIFDPRTLTLSEPTTIHVQGNRIVSIGGGTPYNAAELIDARGKVVLPGLWDMHQHFSGLDAMIDIAAGITSARDLGNDSDTLLALKQKIDSGVAIGPRIVLAGLVDGPGPYKGPTNILAANEEEAKKAIDFFAGRGYEGLKIYSSIKPELVPFMTKYAHSKGMRVSGHIPAGMTASQAVDAGYDEIQHANMLFLNFMPDVTDTRTPARFTEVAKRGADLDLHSPEVRAFIQKLKAHDTVIDPTVTVWEEMFTARNGQPSPSYAMIIDRLPVQIRRGFYTGGLPVPEGMDAKYKASFRRILDLVGELHKAGVKIVAGTDTFPGFGLHRELELYTQAGIPPAEVLRIATLRPAQILGREKDLGTIEAGKLADFIVIDGDPTKNISDIRKVSVVVKDGKIYRPAEMWKELGVVP